MDEGGSWSVFPAELDNGTNVYFLVDPKFPNPGNETLFHLRRGMAKDLTVLEVDRYASAAAWAPDGSAVALLTTEDPNVIPGEIQIYQFNRHIFWF